MQTATSPADWRQPPARPGHSIRMNPQGAVKMTVQTLHERRADLQWAEITVIVLNDLWWQVIQHLVLESPQQERQHLAMK